MPTTPSARFGRKPDRAMLQAVKVVRVALDDFYSALTDEEKKHFNLIAKPRIAHLRGIARSSMPEE
jgi:hypothetical protein